MRTNILVVSALMVLLCASEAYAARIEANGTDLDEARVSRRLSGTASVYPISEGNKGVGGQNFDLVNIGGNTNMDVGCGGLDLKDVLKTYFKSDYENILDYLKANAMSYALTYLIYQNPTLYSLLEQLKGSANFALSSQMVSCQSIRALADKKRQYNDYYAEAKVLCLQDGNTETQCSDDGKLETYLKKAIEQREEKMRSSAASGSGGVSRGSVSLLRHLSSDMNLGQKDKSLLGRLTTDTTFNEGNVNVEPPKETISSNLDTLLAEYGRRINRIFEASNKDPRTFAPGSTNPAYTDLRALNLESGVSPITVESIGRINSYPPLERSVAISRLIRLVAIGKLRSQIRRELMVLMSALQSAKVKDAHSNEVKQIRDSVSDLKYQLELVDDEFSSLERQSKFLTEVHDNAPVSKPTLR